MDSEDLVILLDEAGRPSGTAPREATHHRATPLHQAFSCYAFDPAGRVLLTRRALTKRAWPGVWTNSWCGHPRPGEDLEDAVRRRAGQELGLGVGAVTPKIPEFRYRAVDDSGVVENEVCPVYTAAVEADPVPDPAEVVSWRWVEWSAVVDLVRLTPWAVSPWMAEQVPILDRELAP
ncbi:isopentenyl-diphosphate Delta-isomerase [Ruania suaedae]|uniref:isopentenyl-diphosphate Delta-isomerase n=1 Tax=Ruania suaedae TaxID=2897774 RepID=UPI001E384932|nr:isopentenyl-diphosphate Delta-isomerase [Ruania suaedae]UFU03286.1 isopentenyl-diphosphate Delta-isomerase [Ruania suaedae]